MKSKIKLKLFLPSLLALIAAANVDAVAGVKVDYKIGKGVNFESTEGDYKMNLSGRGQFRFTYNKNEQAADSNTFAVQRGKIKLDGFVLNEDLRFGFQMNLSTRAANSGNAVLEDYFVDYFPISYFGVKVGQFKVPFLHQELTSSGNQQFVDRALSTGNFNLSRDLGVSVHGNLFAKKANYSIFAFNGDGANTINTNQGLLFGTRFEYIPFGEYEYSESDVKNSQELNLGMGVSYVHNSRGTAYQSGTIAAGTSTSHGTFDVGAKFKGFSFNGMFSMTRAHEVPKLTNWGYNGQAGYFVIPEHLEFAVKHGGIIFSNATANQYEYSAGLNYFLKGHSIKWQTDYALIMNSRGANLNDHRVRSQVQVVF